jgi:flagellar protein FliJ
MPKTSAITTLIDIAERETDDAAKRMGKSIHAREEAEQKLALLIQYREDYIARMNDTAKVGLTAAQYANFQSFITQLDSAVDGQQRVLKDAQYRVELAKQEWQAQEKKRLSYNTLHNRSQAVQQKKEAKQDQKQTDESAARAFFYKS